MSEKVILPIPSAIKQLDESTQKTTAIFRFVIGLDRRTLASSVSHSDLRGEKDSWVCPQSLSSLFLEVIHRRRSRHSR